MGLFGIGKKREVIDYSERYKIEQEREARLRKEMQKKTESKNAFGFLGNMANVGLSSPKPVEQEDNEDNLDAEGRKKKLAKRLMDMTDKIEEIGNQIYHLQQRIEVLERRANVKSME